MLLFNNLYENNKKSNNNNLISYSIIKYLINDKEEKLGGTMKYLNDNYAIKINNYDKIIKMKIDNFNSVFLFEFIELFFMNNNTENLWGFLIDMITCYKDFTSEKFISSVKKDSHDEVNSKFLSFLKYKLYFPSYKEIKIFIIFFINLSNILLYEFYPLKLIYFFPVKILLGLIGLQYGLLGIVITFSDTRQDI